MIDFLSMIIFITVFSLKSLSWFDFQTNAGSPSREKDSPCHRLVIMDERYFTEHWCNIIKDTKVNNFGPVACTLMIDCRYPKVLDKTWMGHTFVNMENLQNKPFLYFTSGFICTLHSITQRIILKQLQQRQICQSSACFRKTIFHINSRKC